MSSNLIDVVDENAEFEGNDRRKPKVRTCALHPDSQGRGIWDMCILLILLRDAIMIPFLIAWEPEPSVFIRLTSLVAMGFWTLDLAVNFLTGFYRHGEVVMKLPLIAQNYLRRWFCLDVGILLIDWLSVVVELVLASEGEDISGTAGVLRILKVFRVLRMISMARILRFFQRFRSMGDWTLSGPLGLAAQIAKLVFIVALLNHVCCCFWYGIGRFAPTDTGAAWLDMFGAGGTMTYRDSPPLFQYLTALHWAMTQMTPGSMQVVPNNSMERFFNVSYLIFGFLFGSALISQFSAKMVQVRMSNQEHANRMTTLRRYLRENNINTKLSTTIQKQITERVMVVKRLTEKDVPAFSLLSTSLTKNLRYNSFSCHILRHPLFRVWDEIDGGIICDLCCRAVQFESISPGDCLFNPQSAADKFYFVVEGTLRYTPDKDDNTWNVWRDSCGSEDEGSELGDGGCGIEDVSAGDWVSEAAFWSNQWTYTGTLEAVTQCVVLAVNIADCLWVINKYHRIHSLNHDFCAAFQTEVSNRPGNPDLLADYGMIKMLMPIQSRVLIVQPILEILAEQSSWVRRKLAAKGLDELEKEIVEGTCVLTQTSNGAIERVLMVAAIKISRGDDRILVQLGKFRAGSSSPEPDCALPGAKIRDGEQPLDAALRILKKDLFQIAEDCKLSQTWKVSTQLKDSATYGVRSRYIRTVFHGTCGSRWESEPPQDLLSRTSSMKEFALITCDTQGNKKNLYCWLEWDLFEKLSMPENSQELQKLILTLAPIPSRRVSFGKSIVPSLSS